jgi:sodium/hydrogen exchanger-like protein 6/7
VYLIITKLEFNTELFFDVFLPLIIFATGFNMRRQNFFENIVNIAKFGLLGTTLTFVFYTMFTYAAINLIDFWVYSPYTKDWSILKLDIIEILFVCSIFCSSDIIAAVTIIKFEDQPKLFSIILGEGLFNDAVAIILF